MNENAENNPNAPHVAHFRITYEIMEKMATGEVTGCPVVDDISYGVISGKTFERCQKNAKQVFHELLETFSELLAEHDFLQKEELVEE